MTFSRSFFDFLTGSKFYSSIVYHITRTLILETASDRHICVQRTAIVPKAKVREGLILEIF